MSFAGRPSTLLEGLPAECVGAVTSRLVYVDFCDGDVVHERRERADRMYFIMAAQYRQTARRWPAACATSAPCATPRAALPPPRSRRRRARAGSLRSSCDCTSACRAAVLRVRARMWSSGRTK